MSPRLVASAAFLVTLAGCGGEAPTPAATPSPTAPETIDVTGSMTLGIGDFAWGLRSADDKGCAGHKGYDDIKPGTQVTVTDAAGKVLGLGSLSEGVAEVEGDIGVECVFTFTVPDVPTGEGFYGIEVSHRGVVRFEEEKLQSSVSLTLAD